MDPRPGKSWSIHTRPEIISKYDILRRIGSGAYSDVYLGRRISDGAAVALKEIHDQQSAFREIHALRAIRGHPNVVALLDHFLSDDDDAVLVLEFLRTDLASVIAHAKTNAAAGGVIPVAEVKRWMLQILSGVEACHRAMIVHRDLKPGNLLIGDDGTLKLADFGQARMLMDSPLFEEEVPMEAQGLGQETIGTSYQLQGHEDMIRAEEYLRVLDEVKAKDSDGGGSGGGGGADGSCLATCTASDRGDDYDDDVYFYGADNIGNADDSDRQQEGGCLTSCVGTRWFRAPELLFGSTNYGLEVDLWSLGCIFAELLTLRPLFPGTADIDQLSRIINVLGNLTEEVWPGCLKLPDYGIISFGKVESPMGIEACLPDRSAEEGSLVKRLVCFDPARRATATELIQDKYFSEEPLPVPVSELSVPLTKVEQEGNYGLDEMGYDDSDFDEFGSSATVTTTDAGFSIQFL